MNRTTLLLCCFAGKTNSISIRNKIEFSSWKYGGSFLIKYFSFFIFPAVLFRMIPQILGMEYGSCKSLGRSVCESRTLVDMYSYKIPTASAHGKIEVKKSELVDGQAITKEIVKCGIEFKNSKWKLHQEPLHY